MKIFVEAFLYHNLGDDLFIHILSNRYKEQKFYSVSQLKYKSYPNMKIFGGTYIKFLDLFIKILSRKRKNLMVYLGQKFNYNVCIGGSMYMETSELFNKKLFYDKMKEKKKCRNRYILGINFGPYISNEYFLEYKKYFSESVDVCFRDDKSFSLFKELDNIRKAPDIVFSLDTSNIRITNNKKVIVSVIEIDDSDKYINYLQKIEEMIKYFYKRNYEIVLMSFCEKGGDLKAINRLKNELSDLVLQSYSYTGDIEEALNVFADSSIIIASRYHASILGLLFNKTVIPLAYSDKTIYALNEIGYHGDIIDIRNINSLKFQEYIEKNINYKYDSEIARKESINQFKFLDELFSRGEKNE